MEREKKCLSKESKENGQRREKKKKVGLREERKGASLKRERDEENGQIKEMAKEKGSLTH